MRPPARQFLERMFVLYKGRVTVVWGSEPVEPRDEELDLVDDYDPELDLVDDLDDWDQD